MQIMTNTGKPKVLIIRFSSMGDIVLTTPVMRCLANNNLFDVHFLVKKKYLPIVNNNPYINKVYVFDGDIDIIIQKLKTEHYSYIVDLQNNKRSWQLKSALKCKTSTIHKLNVRKFLLTTLKINILPKKHIVERYMQTVKFLGVDYDGRGLDFFIKDESLPPKVELPDRYSVFAVGSQHFTKRLPTNKIVEVCKNSDCPVVLIGGKEDVAVGSSIHLQLPEKTINLTGKLTVNQSAIVLNGATVVYTGDTGMMHIAAALKKPIVSFWGSTVPAFGMYPFYPDDCEIKSVMVENDKLWCRPCSKIGLERCPLGHFKCMKELNY